MQEGHSTESLGALQNELLTQLPRGFAEFLLHSNRAEGAICKGYVILWCAERIAKLNEAYAVQEFAPGLLLFGTDGGNMGYGFDIRSDSTTVVETPLVGMDWSETRTVASDFAEFLMFLRRCGGVC